jgi:hypothetical protein
MTIKIKCIICKKEVENPKVGQITCGSKECIDKLRSNYSNLRWMLNHKEKVKKYHREYKRTINKTPKSKWRVKE